MIGHPTWVYSATVGDSTAGTSIFPRRRGRARRGALRQEFRGVYPNLGGTAVPGTRGGYPRAILTDTQFFFFTREIGYSDFLDASLSRTTVFFKKYRMHQRTLETYTRVNLVLKLAKFSMLNQLPG